MAARSLTAQSIQIGKEWEVDHWEGHIPKIIKMFNLLMRGHVSEDTSDLDCEELK